MEHVNIATGNAVVGQQIGGRPVGVEAYAWVLDRLGRMWLLVGPDPLGSGEAVYALPGDLGYVWRLNRLQEEFELAPSPRGPVVVLPA